MKRVSSGPVKQALAAAIVVVCASLPVHAGQREDVLSQIMALHGLDEQGAIDRLSAEADAADVYQRVRLMQLEAYAGAWFDADSGKLQVAISDSAQAERLIRLGAVPVLVNWSLRDLQDLQTRISEDAELADGEQLRALYVDYQLNRVVVSAVPGSVEVVREHP